MRTDEMLNVEAMSQEIQDMRAENTRMMLENESLTADNARLLREHHNMAGELVLERDEVTRLTAENAALLAAAENMQRAEVRMTADRDELLAALRDAAYALFQIKRMQPEAVLQFASDAHTKACAVIDGDEVHEQLTPGEKP